MVAHYTISGTTHPQNCDVCRWVNKEPAQWGFEPYCHGYGNHVQGERIPIEEWMWIRKYGCGTFAVQVNKTLD